MSRVFLILLALFVSASATDRLREYFPSDALEPIQRLSEQRVGNDSLLDPLLASSFDEHIRRQVREPFQNVTETCKAVLIQFADQASDFTKCLLRHARPFRLCENCVEHYYKATNMYNDLLGDKNCSLVLLQADRMQVMASTYKTFVDLWTSADCDECFDYVEENSTTGVVTYNFTEETLDFQRKHKNMTVCFNDTSRWNLLDSENATQCTDCLTIYGQLNSQFERMRSNSGEHVCMDLVDMINCTRTMWSKFGCRRPSADTNSVVILTALIGFFTAALYLCSRFNAKIRIPQIFKANRMVSVTRYGSIRQRSLDVMDPSSQFSSPTSDSFTSSNHVNT